jgi:murein DD-endopeptidase MepM/ murein hydrolase activator NlpD
VWRASALAAAAVLGAALGAALGAPPARADEAADTAPPGAPEEARSAAPRAALARQVADELAAIDRARAAVAAKLGEADAARARRIAAAARLLRTPPASPASARMATARQRAAVRLLLERDLAERRLLAAEAAQLRRAAEGQAARAARLPELELPVEIGRPARGKVVRRFGAASHEAAQATLSRRGLELEVLARAAAVAPADGVVRYAGPIRGLDEGVIVDHGSFLTVIAKLGAPAVPVGAPVRRGDRLGHAARRRLYLEVRVKLGAGGLPIDPEPLLPRRERESSDLADPR